MLKFFRFTAATLPLLLTLLGALARPLSAAAPEVAESCAGKRGLELSKCRLQEKKFVESAGLEQSESDITVIAGRVINIVLSIMGVLLLGLTIYGGYLWMTARGDKDQVQKAKDTIERALTGLAIILAAFAISNFVINQLTTATGVGEEGGGGE